MSFVARQGDLTACGSSLISGAKRTKVNDRLVIRLGDTGSHGGEVVTASSKFIVEDKEAARVGDIYACPIHGENPIVQGSENTTDGG